MVGYVKDHRKELESDIWLMPPLYHRVWQYLKYMVNHEDNEIPMRDGSRLLIKRSQHLTSVRDIAKGISWYEGKKHKEPNPKTIDAILNFMVKTEMISINRGKGNREYTLITLINYEVYNKRESQGNSKVTPDGEVKEQQVDINKNVKNDNNEKEVIKDNVPYAEIITYLNTQADKNYKSNTEASREHIRARWAEGFVLEDFKKAIDNKVAEWKGTKNDKYLRPQTLFNCEKFQGYVNEKIFKGGNNGQGIRQGDTTAGIEPFKGKNGILPSKYAADFAQVQ